MNIFLLRWNPAISSWKDADFREALAKSREGPVAMDWSVREWEKLEAWDWALLCRVGTDADGIVAIGRFDGRVEESASWRKDGSKCHYAFFWISLAQDPLRTGRLLADSLEKAVPGIDWHGGHSGVAVPAESAPALAQAIADALESGPVPPGAEPFSNPPYGPGELARSLRLDFCPETFADDFRRALPGHKITFHREDDPDGEAPDCGAFRVLVSNPLGGESLRIDLGGEPTLFFGGSHIHFMDGDDEWGVLLDYAKKIVAGGMRAFVISSGGKWYGSRFGEPRFDGSFVRTEADAFRFIVDFFDHGNGAGEFLGKFARKGAKLQWAAWNPAESGSVELSADRFKTAVRPTGLDAVLASREAQGRKGNGLLDSFLFDFGATEVQCRRTGKRWTVERMTGFGRDRKTVSTVASGFAALLDTPLPGCRKTTIHDALERKHAFDVEVFWCGPESQERSKPAQVGSAGSANNGPSKRNIIEAPLDGAGLYGLVYESAATPRHFRSVRLTDAEVHFLLPAFTEMNATLGVRIDRCEEEILPSFFAAEALALLRAFRDHAADSATRKAAEKILPVFEKAAELRMSVAFWL